MIRKGSRVLFVLADDTEVEPPASYAMLHDPTGRYYHPRAVLVGPIDKGPVESDPPEEAVDYLGSSHVVHRGNVELPPRALSAWKKLGALRSGPGEGREGIFYVRTGKKLASPTRSKRHTFNDSALERALFGRGRATLYLWGDWLRLQLTGKKVILDARGFGWP